MEPNIVAIIGSARNDGNAAQIMDAVLAHIPAKRIDLNNYTIHDYEYGRLPDDSDNFLDLANEVSAADVILLVTPVYWYAMSGVMKRFFDRLTDLTTVMKPMGRALADKTIYVASCGTQPELPLGFEVPFRDTAAYLDMQYGGIYYRSMRDDEILTDEACEEAAAFGRMLQSVTNTLA